jgi:uncharacterized membrane protein
VKLKLLIGVLVFLIVLNLATIGSFVYMRWTSEPPDLVPPAPPSQGEIEMGRPGPRGTRPHERFRLRPEERAELGRLLAELRSETADLELRIAELERQVFERVQEQPVDRDEIDSLLTEISAARLAISRAAADKLIEAKAHLTPDQQELFYRAILHARSQSRAGDGRFHGERPFRHRNVPERRGGRNANRVPADSTR